MVKTDSSGNKQWDETMLTPGSDGEIGGGGYAIPTADGCYAVAISSDGAVGGYKTQAAWDSSYDFWIVKFCMYPTGINEVSPDVNINVYPNPFSHQLSIALAGAGLQQADFSICNLQGQTIYTQHETNLSPTYTKMLDLSYLPNGVYIVEIVIDGELTVREVVKQ